MDRLDTQMAEAGVSLLQALTIASSPLKARGFLCWIPADDRAETSEGFE
ncbi:hypothetical protein [Paenibacillus graminis]